MEMKMEKHSLLLEICLSGSEAKWRQGVRLSFKREGALEKERESIDVWFTVYSIRNKISSGYY